MNKHTPGPWYVTVHTGTDGKINPGSDWTIYANGETYAITYEGGHNPNAAHDARLIAAAPELLEALKEIHEAADTLEPDEIINGNWLRNISADAIAKATGETE